MVDALASGASGRKAVEVRVLSWAPFVNPKIQISLVFCGFEQFTGRICPTNCPTRTSPTGMPTRQGFLP